MGVIVIAKGVVSGLVHTSHIAYFQNMFPDRQTYRQAVTHRRGINKIGKLDVLVKHAQGKFIVRLTEIRRKGNTDTRYAYCVLNRKCHSADSQSAVSEALIWVGLFPFLPLRIPPNRTEAIGPALTYRPLQFKTVN